MHPLQAPKPAIPSQAATSTPFSKIIQVHKTRETAALADSGKSPKHSAVSVGLQTVRKITVCAKGKQV